MSRRTSVGGRQASRDLDGLCVEEQELPWIAAFAADGDDFAPPITLDASKGSLDLS
ncbi:MAG: hypothetical protein JNM84_15235 [Planctomycetes bacterium]|nr:hypothetical protein [Planctomycetota bacterium]